MRVLLNKIQRPLQAISDELSLKQKWACGLTLLGFLLLAWAFRFQVIGNFGGGYQHVLWVNRWTGQAYSVGNSVGNSMIVPINEKKLEDEKMLRGVKRSVEAKKFGSSPSIEELMRHFSPRGHHTDDQAQ